MRKSISLLLIGLLLIISSLSASAYYGYHSSYYHGYSGYSPYSYRAYSYNTPYSYNYYGSVYGYNSYRTFGRDNYYSGYRNFGRPYMRLYYPTGYRFLY